MNNGYRWNRNLATTNYFAYRGNAIRYKKLRNLGSDLGGALRGFKTAMKEDEKDESEEESDETENSEGETIETTAEKVETK